ncbi:MAG TPA: YbaK/EbsC family protein [Firmicutes bacterium]|nr:YbaK/EbsC family protein [Bacillota bacterium]
MDPLKRVRDYLQRNGNFPIILFDTDTSTAPLAAAALGVEVGQIAKSIVFVGKKGSQALVVTCGDQRVDSKKLRQLTGEKMRLANPEETLSITGFPPGGVCPFALPEELPVLVDASLSRYPVVYAAAGTANSAVPISAEQLIRLTGGQVVDLV